MRGDARGRLGVPLEHADAGAAVPSCVPRRRSWPATAQEREKRKPDATARIARADDDVRRANENLARAGAGSRRLQVETCIR